MRYTLKEYQAQAARELLFELAQAHMVHAATGELRAVSLQAPTGAGKTVIAASVIEALLDGDGGPEDDDQAVILWVTTDPALNAQTRTKMLAASSALDPGQLQIIENDFEQRTFTPGTVYFLNTQKLSKGTRLDTGGTESRTHSLWETIATTAKEWGRHFYVVIDEAHVGTGGTDRSAPTITRRIIDGAGGSVAAPVVLGITATPRKFQRAMRGAKRTLNAVEVPIAQVRASGLIKDGVILLAPGTRMVGMEYELVRRAGRRLERYRNLWATHSSATGDPEVNPALIVQFPDSPSEEMFTQTLTALRFSIPGLAEDEIVHTFAEHMSLRIGDWRISHRSPELIAAEAPIRVILAKSAITTGWDCPRAEVMVSLRKVEDSDLIAQIVGRTVRTPLAKRIEGNDRLNSVVAYLPHFNPAGLGSVAAALTPAADEEHADTAVGALEVEVAEVAPMSASATPAEGVVSYPKTAQGEAGAAPAQQTTLSSPDVTTEHLDDLPDAENVFREVTAADFADLTLVTPEVEDGPVFFEIEPSCPQPVLDAIRSLPSQRITERASSTAATTRLMRLAVALEQYGVATGAVKKAIIVLYREMVDHRQRMISEDTWEAAVEAADQVTLTGRKVDAHGFGQARIEETFHLSSDMITARFRKAERALAESMATNYLRLAAADRPEEDANDIRIEAIALADDPVLARALEARAAIYTGELFDRYAAPVSRLAPGPRTQIEELMASLRPVVEVQTTIQTSVKDPGPEGTYFEKHVLSAGGRFRYKANALEKRVLDAEIDHCVAWYRNPSTGNTGLGIHYRTNGADKLLRPDFVFVSDDGRISIVDPHGTHLADGLVKARALASYAAEISQVDRAQVIGTVDGRDLFLDLTDTYVVTALDQAADVEAVYRKHGRQYA